MSPDELASKLRIEQIIEDLKYFRGAMASMGVGSQPPTLYAEKYVADVEFLLSRWQTYAAVVAGQALKSELERALDHDAAGRIERKPLKPKT